MEKKLQVLSKIAKELNRKHVTWAVGASTLLYLNGLVEEFHDIDIMITEECVDKTKDVLAKLGKLSVRKPSKQYRSKHFSEYIIDEVDIDVIAGFVIVKDGVEYLQNFDESNIEKYAEVNGEQIPLQSLSDWHYYYTLMNRPQKAEMCIKYQ